MAEVSLSKYDFNNFKKLLIISIILCIPMLFMVIISQVKSCCVPFDLGTKSSMESYVEFLRYKTMFLKDWRFQLLLAAPMQVLVGSIFYKSSFLAIKNGTSKRIFNRFNRDSPIAIAATILFLYYLFSALFGYSSVHNMKEVHFERPMFVLAIALLEKYIENVMIASKYFSKGANNERDTEENILSLQRFTDKVYEVTIPVTILIALATFIIWYFFIFNGVFYFIEKPILYASSVLIVVYPWKFESPASLKSNLLKTKRKIIFYSVVILIYNAAGIYLAITAHLTPEIAAIAMLIASIFVKIQFINIGTRKKI